MDRLQQQHAEAVLAAAARTAPRSRREFLRLAGFGGAALTLAACGKGAGAPLAPTAPEVPGVVTATADETTIVLDFSTDVGVLNYAYALEQLEAAFYIQVAADESFESTFSAAEQRVLQDVRDHEIAHRDFLMAALAANAIPGLTPDFSAVDFGNRDSVLTTARTFEDLGVTAYNGAARYLHTAAYLTVAGKIVSVEARHASAIRDLLEPRTGAFAPDAFDTANPPGTVLTAADPFIVENISVINA